jgi:hypothetical protein
MVGSFDFAIPPQLDVFGRDPVLAEVGIRSSVTAPCNATYRSIKTGAVKRSGGIRSVVHSSGVGEKSANGNQACPGPDRQKSKRIQWRQG